MVPATKQEYYDLLFCSAIDGSFPAISPGSKRCKYRTSDGKACGAGLLMPDDKYKEAFEGNGVECLTVWEACCPPPGITLSDVSKIQGAHDRCASTLLHSGWDAEVFVKDLNKITCFGDVSRLEGVPQV